MGKLKAVGLAIVLAAAATILGGCGSGEGDATAAGGSLPPGTAESLAGMSDEIAAALEAGDVCGAAARADDLQAAVSEAKIPDELRPEVEAGADQLVNEVNCGSTEQETTTSKEEEKGDEEHGGEDSSGHGPGGEGSGSEGSDSSGPHGQGGDFVPPGQAKIRGGI